jgi:hypothetical protein
MVEKYVHHGTEVSVLSDVKGKHRSHCLCFQGCKRFEPGSKFNCPIAQAVYANCVRFNLTTPVYECPDYEPK